MQAQRVAAAAEPVPAEEQRQRPERSLVVREDGVAVHPHVRLDGVDGGVVGERAE